MALNKAHMKTIIRRHNHLEIEGDETTEELRTALFYMRDHTWNTCRKENKGIPIESLIPDAAVLGKPIIGRTSKGRFTRAVE